MKIVLALHNITRLQQYKQYNVVRHKHEICTHVDSNYSNMIVWAYRAECKIVNNSNINKYESITLHIFVMIDCNILVHTI